MEELLPHDVIEHILVRLAVKTLLKFKSVSKQWKSTIQSPSFQKRQLIQNEEKIDDSLEFLILASDGLWDVFSNEEAIAMVKEVEDPEESAKKLVGEAIKRGSADNITCIVVRFLENKTSLSSHASSSSSNQMPPLGDLAVSSNEANQVQIDSENISSSGNKPENVKNRKPVPASSLTDEVTVNGLGNKLENSVNRKPVPASSSTDAVTLREIQ